MASLSKGTLRTITRSLLGDSENQAWTDPILDILIGSSIDKIWSNILDFSPWFHSWRQIVDPALYAPNGIFDTVLIPAQRLYKIQQVTRNGQVYMPVSKTSAITAPEIGSGITQATAVVTAPMFSYTHDGAQLILYPVDVVTPFTLTYSYLPTNFLTLLDSVAVDFPEGFELIIAHDVVFNASGDAQTMTNAKMKRDELLDSLYSKIKRFYIGPAVMNSVDDQLSWGSV